MVDFRELLYEILLTIFQPHPNHDSNKILAKNKYARTVTSSMQRKGQL